MGDEFRKQIFVILAKIIGRKLTPEEDEKIRLSLIAYVESVKVIERVDRIYVCKECHQSKKVSPSTDRFLRKLGPAQVETKSERKIFSPSLEALKKE